MSGQNAKAAAGLMGENGHWRIMEERRMIH
jgi:hypothetical protein